MKDQALSLVEQQNAGLFKDKDQANNIRAYTPSFQNFIMTTAASDDDAIYNMNKNFSLLSSQGPQKFN
eukprot:CAMPEP_0170566924 /NCGR_PEP_ID=MMETSP0211-20121228/80154_1 /TAXON_ID=311385 /ORGANISM="Pseudokeronopsis sp., Strain OXSARD2" /LENGTH=67 /DNA_ID=CAMNT_0010888239 /DNA_START=991 /DNA_END=1194 /DNA_ORIENTATION=-